MKLNFLIGSSVLVLFLALDSCKDNQAPVATQRFRIKKTTTTYTSSTQYSYDVYRYSATNRLDSIVNYSVSPNTAPYVFGLTTMYYDSQGRLTKNEIKVALGNANPILPIYYMNSFGYGQDNRVETIKKYKIYTADPSHPSLMEDRQLTYEGGAMFPVSVTTKINTGSQFDPDLYFTEDYTYSSGNIVAIKRIDKPTHFNGYNASTSTRTFQYDDKPNPFYGLTRVEYDERTFSKNNIIESYNLYTYDSNWLLTKVAARDGSSETIYEYEAY